MIILGRKIRKRTIIIVTVLIVLMGTIFILTNDDFEGVDFIVAERGDLIQEISFTGRVKAAENLDLAFEQTGRVSWVYVDVGDQVFTGQSLVQLSAGELLGNYNEANANVEVEEARLLELKRGLRPEEIEIKEAELAKVEQDLTNYYSGVSDIVNDAYTKADDAVRNQTDALFKNDDTTTPDLSFIVNNFSIKINVESLRASIGKDLENWQEELLNIFFDSPKDQLEVILENSRDYLLGVRDFLNLTLDSVNESTSLPASTVDIYKTDVNTGRTNINLALSSINGRLQNIAVQKITVGKSKQELELARAGTANEQVLAQEARVKQAKAAAESAGAKLAKTTLRAPFAGIITKKDVRVGEIVSANTEIISLISQAEFEIESFIPESDIAKVTLGNVAKVTLDAYTSEDIFEASILSMDLSETIIEGVATYKTILQFTSLDPRIKSGMTANVDVLTASKENVIAIPQRSLIIKNGKKFVKIIDGGNISDVEVVTGLRGSAGEIEIISGIEEGDKVVTFIKKK